MGADKKALVIAQLQAAGIKVTSWLDHQIDVIVATLNKTGAWLATKTQEGISGMNQTRSVPMNKQPILYLQTDGRWKAEPLPCTW